MSYALPLGPHHPLLPGPLDLVVHCAGETVEGATVRAGLGTRDVASLVLGRSPDDALPLIERICAFDSTAHSLAFCQAIECVTGSTPSPRATYLRVLWAELERACTHGETVAGLLRALGAGRAVRDVARVLDELYDLRGLATGATAESAGAFGLIVPGGLARDISGVDELSKRIRGVEETWAGAARALARALPSSRFKGLGVLTSTDLGGPLGRAAGSSADVRRGIPYAAYGDLAPDASTRQDGDVPARYAVLLAEIGASLQLVRQVLERLPEGEIRVSPAGNRAEPASGDAEISVEAPGGAETLSLHLSEGRITVFALDTPSRRHLPALPHALVNAPLADAGAIVASLGLCVGCIDV